MIIHYEGSLLFIKRYRIVAYFIQNVLFLSETNRSCCTTALSYHKCVDKAGCQIFRGSKSLNFVQEWMFRK